MTHAKQGVPNVKSKEASVNQVWILGRPSIHEKIANTWTKL